MKVRNGFVSNSSSSSFIVRLRDSELIECENCKKILESIFEIKNAREYVVENHYYDSWQSFLAERKEEEYTSILTEAVEENEKIMIADVEYGEEEPYYKVLNALGLEYEDEG